ncbi:hypothetical protein BJX70DRAFT_395349 [Aspergillus crustosus]
MASTIIHLPKPSTGCASCTEIHQSIIDTGVLTSEGMDCSSGTYPVVYIQSAPPTPAISNTDLEATINTMRAWLWGHFGQRVRVWSWLSALRICEKEDGESELRPGYTVAFMVDFPRVVEPQEMVDQGLFSQSILPIQEWDVEVLGEGQCAGCMRLTFLEWIAMGTQFKLQEAAAQRSRCVLM